METTREEVKAALNLLNREREVALSVEDYALEDKLIEMIDYIKDVYVDYLDD